MFHNSSWKSGKIATVWEPNPGLITRDDASGDADGAEKGADASVALGDDAPPVLVANQGRQQDQGSAGAVAPGVKPRVEPTPGASGATRKRPFPSKLAEVQCTSAGRIDHRCSRRRTRGGQSLEHAVERAMSGRSE